MRINHCWGELRVEGVYDASIRRGTPLNPGTERANRDPGSVNGTADDLV